MTRSDDVKELVTSLAKAQGIMKPAVKDSENPHFRSRYADLASVWDACRGPLTANGLSVVQAGDSEGPVTFLVTTLFHSSGQWISSTLPIPTGNGTPQAVGAGITYMRRFALMALVGIAPEDDDGNAVQQASPVTTHESQAKVVVPATNQTQSTNGGPPRTVLDGHTPGTLTDKQIKRLFAISRQAQWTNEQVKAYMTQTFKILSTSQLTKQTYDSLCSVIEGSTFQQAIAEVVEADVDMVPPSNQNQPHGGTQNEMYPGDLNASH